MPSCERGDEDADDVELDEASRLCLEADDQRDRGDGQDNDAIRVRQAVATAHHLVRQEGIARQDRREGRETVERSITGQHEDEPGDDRDENEEDRSLPKHCGGDLGDRRVDRCFLRDGRALVGQLGRGVVDNFYAGRTGKHEDRNHHRSRDQTEHRQRGRRVARLGAAEHRHTIGDRLDAGEGRTARGERSHEQEGASESGKAVGMAGSGDEVVGGGGRLTEVSCGHLRESDDDHEADGPHVQIRGHGERSAGLTGAAQVQGRQNDNKRDGDGDLVTEESRDGRRDVAGAR